MMSGTTVAHRDLRRSRFVSVRAILGDRRQRVRLWIDGVLRRNAAQPRRLEALRQAMLEDGRAPFKAAAAVAEIQRFRADPAVYRSPKAAWWGNGDGLAGAYIPHVLDAQALAFSDRPSEAAEAMRKALDALGGSTESQATPASVIGRCSERLEKASAETRFCWPTAVVAAFRSCWPISTARMRTERSLS